MNVARLVAYALVGLVMAISAQVCWGISTSLPEWRLLAGWALMVFAIFCWQRASDQPARGVAADGAPD
jgi:sulfite exporter TauE/SafE